MRPAPSAGVRCRIAARNESRTGARRPRPRGQVRACARSPAHPCMRGVTGRGGPAFRQGERSPARSRISRSAPRCRGSSGCAGRTTAPS